LHKARSRFGRLTGYALMPAMIDGLDHAGWPTVAERDLRELFVPLLSGEIVVNREGADLGPGDVILLCSTRLGLADVVMRISEIG
jgi:hypothetical protein